ncbi:unnamed protein product [Prunus armeniaca]
MGPIRTPDKPTTRGNSSTYHIIPSYDGTHPATYGVCQHAGYSYDTCDLNTISPHTTGGTQPRMGSVNTPATPTTRATSTQSLIIRRDAPGLVWGLSTCRILLRHVRPQHNNNITPHTTGRTRPRMGSVNMLGRKVTLPRKSHGQSRGQTTHPWSNGPAGPTTSKFQSDSFYECYLV